MSACGKVARSRAISGPASLTQAPAEYVLGEAEFAGRLRAHDDRQPEIRKVSDGVRDSYALCFPRRLLPAIRV